MSFTTFFGNHAMFNTLAFGMPMGAEWIVIAALGLLIFGKRLPEVGKSLGQGIVQFKKGLKGVEEEVTQVDEEPAAPRRLTDSSAAAPGSPEYKFDPYTGKPIKPDAKFDPYTGKPVDEAAATHSENTPSA
jgi:sec-independent protein translocase protein TatA